MVVWSPPWIKPLAVQPQPPVQPQPAAPAQTDILTKWQNNELPPSLLQAAQVPSYDDWKFQTYTPEPNWGVTKPQGYTPRQVEMRPATGQEKPAEYAPYQPDITGELPQDVYSSFAKIPTYTPHPSKAITAGVLERYPEATPDITPAQLRVDYPKFYKGMTDEEIIASREGGLYAPPSAEKYEKIRQMMASEVPSLPLYVTPIGPEAKGAKAAEKIAPELIEQATKFAKSQLAKKGIGAMDDIILGISKSMPKLNARKIVEEVAERAGLLRWIPGKKVAEKIPEVAPKVTFGEIPPNLPPKVKGKLQPIAVDPLADIKQKILLLNERVKSAITKQEALYRAARRGRFGRAEEKLTQVGTAEEAQRAALHELRGQLPKATYAPEDVGLTVSDKALVKDWIRFNKDYKTTERVNALDAIDRLWGKFDKEGNRILPQRNQVKLINEMLGTNLPTEGKKLSLILDILNIPRSSLASFDVSGGFRQNVFFLFGHPITSAKAMWQGGIKPFFGEMANDFAGAANYLLKKSGNTKEIRLNNWTKEIEASIEANPWYDKLVDAGWPITERSAAGGKILKMEETFASKFASRIPFVKWAEAGYVNLLNKARVDVGSSCLDKWVRAGVNVDDAFIQKWGQIVGVLTGRGDWEAMRQALPFFNSVLFSPRLQLARIQLVPTYLQCWKNPAYRPIAREMTRNIVAFVAGQATLIGLTKVAMDTYGKDKISVEFNPISTDFGKTKIGNTRVDFAGGFIPYIRLIAQLTTNRKLTAAGKVVSLDEWPYGGRWGQLTSFTEMKFAPVTSLVRDVMQGHDAVGNPIVWTPRGIGVEVYKRLSPMVIQDTIDAVNEHGLVEGMAFGTLSFFGATVTTYQERKPKQPSKENQIIPFTAPIRRK